MSLEGCIKKAGKAFRKEDADAIRKIRDDIYGVGDVSRDTANEQALNEYIEIIEQERVEVLKQAEERGGVIADRRLSPSRFAEQAGERMEEAAREFPKLGLQRARTSNNLLDMLSMSLPELHKVLNHFDPEMAAEVLEAHGGMEGLEALDAVATEDAMEIFIEHIEPHLADAKNVKLFYQL